MERNLLTNRSLMENSRSAYKALALWYIPNQLSIACKAGKRVHLRRLEGLGGQGTLLFLGTYIEMRSDQLQARCVGSTATTTTTK
jgi:hypothetical protein